MVSIQLINPFIGGIVPAVERNADDDDDESSAAEIAERVEITELVPPVVVVLVVLVLAVPLHPNNDGTSKAGAVFFTTENKTIDLLTKSLQLSDKIASQSNCML
jgi:hypothetical protein